jgi:hypothetical protein
MQTIPTMAQTSRKQNRLLNRREIPNTIAGRNVYVFIIGGLGITAAMIAVCFSLYRYSNTPPAMPVIPIDDEKAVVAMAMPDLSATAILPPTDAVEAQAEAAKESLRENAALLSSPTDQSIDAFTLAWGAAALESTSRERAIHVYGDELTRAKLSPGTPIVVHGTLVAAQIPRSITFSRTGGAYSKPVWCRLIVETSSGSFVESLVHAGDDVVSEFQPDNIVDPALAIDLQKQEDGVEWTTWKRGDGPGQPAMISGIFLGQDTLAVNGGQSAYPVIIADNSALDKPAAPTADDESAPWSQIDDDRLLLERDPYYHLIGKISANGANDPEFADPPWLNEHAASVYADADAYRGKPFSVTGIVVRSWVDERVAVDHPSGVERVVRILMYKKDWSFERDKLTNQSIKRNLVVARMYEIAAITDQPLPKENETIIATGRFLKFLARPYVPNEKESMRPQSDKVYSLFVVAPGYQIAPPVTLPMWSVGIIVVVSFFSMVLIRYGLRERREHKAFQEALAQSLAKREEQKVKLGIGKK